MDEVVAEKGTWENLARDSVTMAINSCIRGYVVLKAWEQPQVDGMEL